MLQLDTKISTDYIVSSCWWLTGYYLFLEKLLTIVLVAFQIEPWTEPVHECNIDSSGHIELNQTCPTPDTVRTDIHRFVWKLVITPRHSEFLAGFKWWQRWRCPRGLRWSQKPLHLPADNRPLEHDGVLRPHRRNDHFIMTAESVVAFAEHRRLRDVQGKCKLLPVAE